MDDIYLLNVVKKTFIFLLLLINIFSFGQSDCKNDFKYTLTDKKGQINWKQFPEFSLPFKIVYSGPRFNDSEQLPLKHGFSHLSTFTNSDFDLPRQNRAILWYGVASLGGQPWYENESPWGNNLEQYQNYWKNYAKDLANIFSDTRSKAMPDVDLFVLDVEREISSDAGIRFLKNDPIVPSQYRKLNDIDFTERYKIDLSKLYAEPIKFLKKEGISNSTNFASYSDAPIKNSEFPLNFTWQEWQTSDRVLNYYMIDTLTKKVGGEFYNQNTFLTPSAYFCYEYSGLKEYANVAYQLFQVEANIARSSKDVMLFQWLTYNKCQVNSQYKFDGSIKKHLIESQAIMPFFSGAKGIWLWEGNTSDSLNYATYEIYINSLFRLSQFKEFFTGNFQLIIPKSAYQHFQDRDPIWRGVIKGNEILIAAINEFANESETTELVVNYGDWSQKISLKGKEIFLCKFPLPDLQNSFSLYPNPTKGNFTFEYFGEKNLGGKLEIFDYLGREILFKMCNGDSKKQIISSTFPSGSYFLRYSDADKVVTKKFIID
jgi:Secretion system C-terminal sorting domain